MVRAGLFLFLSFVAALPAAAAQVEYPRQPIKLVVPFAPGGTAEILARIIADRMSCDLGQAVFVETIDGAGSTVGTETVARAKPDGYTLLMNTAPSFAINPLIYKKLPYDGVNDFTPISLLATFPQLVLVHPSVKASTLPELIQLAKTASPPLTYASGGNGSSQHLAGALFAHMAKLNLTHVAYKGGNPAQLDLMAGNVNMMITQPNSKELITTGKMRALAVSSARRSQYYPELPTVAEAGVPGYESVAWYGLLGPKGMPPELVKRIADETVRACATEGAKSIVAGQGGDMVAGTPAEFADFIVAERKRYEAIVREANMTVE
jgi:tripartite-type tricarboxylate transporter receptor subunit TctC